MKNKFKVLSWTNLRIVFTLVIICIILTGVILIGNFNLAYADTGNNSLVFPESVAVDSKYVYYVSPYDSNIYRIEIGSHKKSRITINESGEDGIILNNGYIYYEDRLDKNKLHAVSIDGSRDISIGKTAKYLAYDNFFRWMGNIYFYDANGSLNSIKDNVPNVKFNKGEQTFLKNISRYSEFYKGSLFAYGPNESSGLWKINLNNSKKVKIISDSIYPIVKIYGDYIYYVNYNDYKLYRVLIHGKGRTRLTDYQVVDRYSEYDLGNFQIFNGKIYCMDYSTSGRGSLMSMNTDGKNKRTVRKNVLDFNIYKNNLYIMSSVQGEGMYRVSLDGRVVRKIASNNFMRFEIIEKDVIVYRVKSEQVMDPENGKLFMIDINGKNNMELK